MSKKYGKFKSVVHCLCLVLDHSRSLRSYLVLSTFDHLTTVYQSDHLHSYESYRVMLFGSLLFTVVRYFVVCLVEAPVPLVFSPFFSPPSVFSFFLASWKSLSSSSLFHESFLFSLFSFPFPFPPSSSSPLSVHTRLSLHTLPGFTSLPFILSYSRLISFLFLFILTLDFLSLS